MEMNHMREWDKLQVFYFVAKFASITKAGQYLNVSQPSVSRTIRLLEENLKTNLFERIARGVVLTKSGQILFDHVTKIMSEVSAALKFIEGDEEQAKGPLKILTTHGTAYSWLVFFVPEFLDNYPNIFPMIDCETTVWDMSKHDVAILPYLPNEPNLVQEYLITFKMGLYASEEYLNKFGTPKTLDDLNNHKLIVYGEYMPNPPGHLGTLVRKANKNIPHVQINSLQGRLHLTELGLGIAEFGKDDVRVKKAGLVEVLPAYESAGIDMYYIYHKTMKTSERVQCLLRYLQLKSNKERQ